MLEPHFTQAGYWNGEPTATFTACIIKPKENTERPMHWYNPHAGTEMQALEVTQYGHSFIIWNDDGTGYHKVTKGRGMWTSGHRSFDGGYELVKYLPQSEMIKEYQPQVTAKFDRITEEYQERTNKAEYNKLKILTERMNAYQKLTPEEKVKHIQKNGCI